MIPTGTRIATVSAASLSESRSAVASNWSLAGKCEAVTPEHRARRRLLEVAIELARAFARPLRQRHPLHQWLVQRVGNQDVLCRPQRAGRERE